MLNNLDKLPKIINLLVQSYNPHVRYGAAMALGIASHGRYNQQVVNILEPMLKDNADIVRQAAYISMAMVLQHMNPSGSDKRDVLDKAINEMLKKTNVDSITRFGVLFSQSILEAGGRNQTIQLLSRNGEVKMRANLGMLVFL